MSLLEVHELVAGYGELEVLHGVDIYVDGGEYISVVGPNGAGKSTLMKAVFGLSSVMGGSIKFKEDDITELDTEEVIRRGIGYVPQVDNVFTSLSVEENLEMGAYILDEVPRDTLEDIYDRFPVLGERRDRRADELSGGERQMLAMGRALMLEPDLLLLDEPSAGLAPELVEETLDRVDRINDEGTAVVIVEQNAEEALTRCDRGYVLAQGSNRFEGRGEELLEDEDVRQEFLGG